MHRYSGFVVQDDWAYARKLPECRYTGEVQVKRERHVEVRTERVGLGALLLKIKRRLSGDSW